MFVVIVGNPIDGLLLYGPFNEKNTAADWASDNVGADWWIAAVSPPPFFEQEV